MVVAVRCHFVHVASNKKSFSKVKKKVKKVTNQDIVAVVVVVEVVEVIVAAKIK